MLLLIHARIEEVQQVLHYERGLPNERMKRPQGLQNEMERPQGLPNERVERPQDLKKERVERPQGLPNMRMRGHQLMHFLAGDGPIEHNHFTCVNYSLCKYISKLLSLTS